MSLVDLPETIDLEHPASPASSAELSPDSDAGGGSGIARKLVVLLVILGVVSFTAWKIYGNLSDPTATSGGGKKQSGGGDRAVPVTMSSVQQKTMPIYLNGLGTVTAYYSVTIKTRVDGELMSVNVGEGQKVKKGQLLAQIDPGPYAAALAQAEGQLAKDKATANYASVEAERYTKLFNAGVVSQDSQQIQAASAGQSEGAIQADKATIQAAKVNLAYTRINSPIDGVVGLRQVDPGNIVHAGDTTGMLLVTQLQPVSVIFTLPEDELPQVQQTLLKGAKLDVEAYDRTQKTRLATGKLLTLDNQIDTTTGTDKVKAVFDNKGNTLFPNQFVYVRLILEQRPDTLVIPSAAVQTGAKGNFVYVVKKGDPPAKSDDSKSGSDKGDSSGKSGSGHKHEHKDKPEAAAAPAAGDGGAGDKGGDKKYYVEVRPITIDVTEGTQVIVSGGLAAGEQVVIDGLEKLKNGTKVTPKSGDKSSKEGGAAADAARPDSEGKNGKSGHKDTSGRKDKAGSEGSAATDDKEVGAPHVHHHHGQQP
jgi:multidrug efflux system membrane fusion protein